jgi:CO/xanthine dehydrogenase Mo-binding subunit
MSNMIEFRKDLFADERDDNLNEIGKPTRRQDIQGHVTGRSPFFDDHQFDGLLHLRCTRSTHHHARIRRIDTAEAERMPGVVRVLTGRDVPLNLNTLLSLLDFGIDDEPLLSEKKVAYKGEPVAAVIAETEAEARAAAAAVRVEWEVLPHVLDVEEAIKPGAPVVLDIYPTNKFIYHGKYDHQKLRYGDVEAAFRTADHIVEGRYQMSPIEQAPIETCGAIAAPEQNGRYVCYTSTQALFFSLGTAAKVLKTPSSRLHFVGGTVGGGFGGKVDSIHEPLAILGAMLTGRPVKYAWDREEEMQVGAPRGAERWFIKDGVMRDGRIVARKFTGYFDSGAYTRLSSYAIIKGVGHLPGPYTIPNVHADVYCVYTNRTPATAMRGFGITGVDFAIEAHMDKVAETVGINPIDLRILNAYRDGDMKAHRREAKNCALVECCQVVAEKAGVRLSPEALAASSLTGGGGERGRLPAVTATDEAGRVQGYTAGSYARRGAAAPAAAQPRPFQPQPVQPRQPASPPPPRPAAPAASAPPPPERREEEKPAPARRGAMRFSSLSGFRRR